jgi:hypothetical protein
VLIYQRAALRQAGKLNQRGSHVIGRQIKAALASNSNQRAATVRDKIEGLMVARELKEAWRCLMGWYSMVEDHAPKASHDTLVRQTEERIALYTCVPPAGEMLPINVQPFDINDDVPSDSEIKEVVRELQNGQAAGATGLQAKHIKVWLQDVVQEEKGGPAQVFPPIIFFSGGRPNFLMHQNPPKNRQTPNKERPIF